MSIKTATRTFLDRAGLAWVYVRYFEWLKAQDAEPTPAVAEDGIALPPAFLRTLVAGTPDWRWFATSGRPTAEMLDAHAREGGCGFAQARRILDFGCGCGRVIRHLPKMTEAELYGVDYNPRLVRWCAQNLKGTYKTNRLLPPLRFPDAHFDVIYLMSIFTHMRRETQEAWLPELRRVTRPGGVVLITFHDEHHRALNALPEVRAEVLANGLAIHNDQFEGSNRMATYQTVEATGQMVSKEFEIVRIIPDVEASGQQAVAILRRAG